MSILMQYISNYVSVFRPSLHVWSIRTNTDDSPLTKLPGGLNIWPDLIRKEYDRKRSNCVCARLIFKGM